MAMHTVGHEVILITAMKLVV